MLDFKIFEIFYKFVIIIKVGQSITNKKPIAMKKSILILATAVSVLTANAQEIFVKKIVDQMEDKPFYIINKSQNIVNATKTKALILDVFVEEKDGEIFSNELAITMYKIGSMCVHNNELTILFEDSTKIKLESWNKFNCKGNAYFTIDEEQKEKLSTLKMNKIKIVNGDSNDSCTFTLTAEESKYFIKVFKAIKEKSIKIINK